MNDGRLLAIDVGLTNVKAAVFDPVGTLVASTTVVYVTDRPSPDAVEHDPGSWWSAIVKAVNGLPMDVRDQVVGLGVTGHMHALVCLGADGGPIGPALVLGDRRAASDALDITRYVGAQRIYDATGAELDASMPAAKARYLSRTDPETWTSVAHLLGCKDYLRFRLTGQLATEPIDACATSLYDIRTGRWSTDLLEATGITEAMLPPICPPWSVAGSLLLEPATALGLRAALPVAVGAGDDVVVLGFGLLDPGVAVEHIGTTGSVMAVADRRISDPDRGLEVYPHVLPGRWVVGGSHTTAGAAIGWAAEFLGYSSIDDASASLDTPPVEGVAFLPMLAGERFPARVPEARGAWVGLPLGLSRESLMRASFEGVANALAAILRRIDQLAGPQSTIRGAIAGNTSWVQLRADKYGRPFEVSGTSEPTALGLASLVAVACGMYADPQTAVATMTRVVDRVEPKLTTDITTFDPERVLRAAWAEVAAGRRAAIVPDVSPGAAPMPRHRATGGQRIEP